MRKILNNDGSYQTTTFHYDARKRLERTVLPPVLPDGHQLVNGLKIAKIAEK
jgi:hypothetical protein